MITKKVLENKDKVISGAITAGDLVRSTIGPLGKTVLIMDENTHNVFSTKDGVTVAKAFTPSNPAERMGAVILRSIALKTNEISGDGTSSSCSMARYILANKQYKEGFAGKHQFDKAKKELLDALKKYKKDVKSADDIYKVAYISSNGDESVANIVKEVYKDLNPHTKVIVEEGHTKTIIKESNGVILGRGLFSPYPVQNYDNPKVVYTNPYIFLYDGKLHNPNILLNALEVAHNDSRPIVIVAEEVSGDVLKILAEYHRNGTVQSAVVISPGVDYTKMELMEDISFITGASIITPQTVKFRKEFLGTADKVYADRFGATAVRYDINKEHLMNRINKIKKRIEDGLESDWHVRKQEERIASLAGKAVVVKVGADSPEERKELTYRIEDAMNSALNALKEGYVEGGGITFLRLYLDTGEKYPWLRAVTEDLLRNGDIEDPETAVDDILDVLRKGHDVAIYAAPDEEIPFIFEEGKTMFDFGIIDSYTSHVEIIKAVSSVIGLFATTGYVFINKNEDGITNY